MYLDLRMDRFDAVTHMGDPWLVSPGTLIPVLGGLLLLYTYFGS